MNWTINGAQVYICKDILFSILEFLPLHTVISGFAPTCHKFRRTAASYLLPRRGIWNTLQQPFSHEEALRLHSFYNMLCEFATFFKRNPKQFKGVEMHLIKKWNANAKITDHELFRFLGSDLVELWDLQSDYFSRSLTELFFESKFHCAFPVNLNQAGDYSSVMLTGMPNDKMGLDIAKTSRLLSLKVSSFLCSITHVKAMKKLSSDDREDKTKSIMINIPLNYLSELFLNTLDIYSIVTQYKPYTIEQVCFSCEQPEFLYGVTNSKLLSPCQYGGVSLFANNANILNIRLSSSWSFKLFRELLSYLYERDNKILKEHRRRTKPFSISFGRDFEIDNVEEVDEYESDLLWPKHLFHLTVESQRQVDNISSLLRKFLFTSHFHLTIRDINIHGHMLKILQHHSLSHNVSVLDLDLDVFEFMGMSDINLFNQQVFKTLPFLFSYTISHSKICTTQEVIQNREQFGDFLAFFDILQWQHKSLRHVAIKDLPIPYPMVVERLKHLGKTAKLTLQLDSLEVSVYVPRNTTTDFEPHIHSFKKHAPTISNYHPIRMSEYAKYSDTICAIEQDLSTSKTSSHLPSTDPNQLAPPSSSCSLQ